MTEELMEKAVFVGIIRPEDDERKVNEYLDELQFLAETAGVQGEKKFLQRLERPDNATYIRSGKLEEIAQFCEDFEINYVIFDDELSGMQQRNIEKIIKTSAVIDRTSLILEIFAQRAKTSYAKMQVELARYNYMLPRLAGMWTHLERQRGGRGTRGGMGETQIEVDRRIVKERITRLKEQLRKVDRQMATQRGNRGNMVRLALVGYTNVGKSTIMNLLAKSDVFAENKLFATLDTTVRKVVIENNTYYKTGMSAILIEADAEGWYESGPVKDVLIKGNTFIDCAYNGGPGHAVIAIHPSNKIIDAERPVHQNIRIEDNTFRTFDYPVLYAKSTAGLLFRNNTIVRTETFPAASGNPYVFYLNGCKKAVIEGTVFEGETPRQSIKTENMKRKDLKTTIK